MLTICCFCGKIMIDGLLSWVCHIYKGGHMAKRNNREGTIRKRSDGRWEGRYFDLVAQKQKSVYGKTQKEVREKLLDKQEDTSLGIHIDKGMTTMSVWMDVWLKSYTLNVKPLTIDSYSMIMKNHIIPAIGHIRLCDLSTQTLQCFYNFLLDEDEGKGLSVKTVKNVHCVVHKALEQAYDLRYIKINPAGACVLPKTVKKNIVPMDSEMIKTFINTIKGNRFFDVYFVTLFTGMRQGEVLGLTWDCIDFKKGTITIRKQLQKRKGKGSQFYFSPTKNSKERLIVPAEAVMNLLKKVKIQQNKNRLLAGENWNQDPKWDGLVFTTENGKYLHPNTVYKQYKKLVSEMDESYLRFHDLRHSFAVLSLENGDDIKTVQETLGHHSAAFTMDTYMHTTNLMQKKSADRMQEYISSI